LRQEREKVERLSGLRNRSVWKGVDFVLADVIEKVSDPADAAAIARAAVRAALDINNPTPTP